ncbi:carbohydrate kinase family protein [Methylobrevis albus]|uniref:Sugar kinase n=1 Tax=Methylobrevis albus TaxID=2793297 RepID=A0A931I441_9HYPH|nr:sugar kinase [Methylobrevis albus]MBH0239897.1 sugar kinase [Methylobrevis albus]
MAEPGGRSVVVIGDVMTDVIVRPEGPMRRGSDCRATIRRLPGGSGANQAAWLARFGVPTRFVARVGRADHAGLSEDFRAAGIAPRLAADDGLPTGILVTLVEPGGERSFFTDRGANDALSDADLPDDLLDGAAILHVSGYALVAPGPRAAVLRLMARAKAAGVLVSVDPASAGFLADIDPAAFLDWTAGADFCFPNADEAALLAGSTDPATQLEHLGARYGTLVVKRGAAGAEALSAGRHHIAAAPAVAAIDSTGAGDAFLAAYLAAHLGGADVPGCLRAAVAAGARICTVLGGRPSALSGA